MRRLLVLSLLAGSAVVLEARADAGALEAGVEAFERRDWSGAMDQFLIVLRADPANARAHAYVEAIAKKIADDRRSAVDRGRLAMLQTATQRVEGEHEEGPLHQALDETEHAGARREAQRLDAKVEEARLQRGLGHLLAANDLVFQVLQVKADHAAAQRELSELQSALRRALDRAEGVSVADRYALEGLYAYGQANDADALAAWAKARTIATQGRAPGAAPLALLHIAPHEARAQARVDEARRKAQLQVAFQKAVTLFENRRFGEALDTFRAVAIEDPEFPRLAYYLVQVETAAERDRAARLGDKKRQEIAGLLQQGEVHLEKERFAEARRCFERVLALDAAHARARSDLAMVMTELKKRHDPRAAQLHYESGLIAYASGKLDEAAREWRMATRSDPGHEKAVIAYAKVQKELAISREAP